MFVEVVYRYQPMLARMFFKETTFRREAAFIVRDDRNLLGNGGSGVGGTAGANQCN